MPIVGESPVGMEDKNMKADHLPNQSIAVSGHLEERRGYFHIALNWIDRTGKRGRKSVSTGLAVKGNKKRAEAQLSQARKEQEELLNNLPDTGELLFADFIEQWLDFIKPHVRLTTFGRVSKKHTESHSAIFSKTRHSVARINCRGHTRFL